ncbi:hypothetical protein GCM10010253_06660 [Streptomyces badius]|uniref:Uncharacterized protein n=1 Tax=Streptomyces badius TaxID=1941 RepID=A0ABQ2SRT7_STRBA|nr:hypothetical protein GCM10010253_06660 [Streptomyces badius]
MERETRVAAQVQGLERVRHHAEEHLTEAEVGLQAGDPGRAVLPQGGEDVVLLEAEAGSHGVGEFGLGGGEAVPGGRGGRR